MFRSDMTSINILTISLTHTTSRLSPISFRAPKFIVSLSFCTNLACMALRVLADWQSTCHSVLPWSLQIVMEKRP